MSSLNVSNGQNFHPFPASPPATQPPGVAGPGDFTTPNNVLAAQTLIPVYVRVQRGTDAVGIQDVSPEDVKIEVEDRGAAGLFVTTSVAASNQTADTAAMSLKLARVHGAIIVDERQEIGTWSMERSVKRSEDANDTMAKVEASTTHSGVLATTCDDNTLYTVAKVPAGARVLFVTTTRHPPPAFAREVRDPSSQGTFDIADVAIALPMAPLGASMPTTVSLLGKNTLRIPTSHAAEFDKTTHFHTAQQVTWMETDVLTLPHGTPALTVVKMRLCHAIEALSLDCLSIGGDTLTAVPSGYDEDTGVKQHALLLDMAIPDPSPCAMGGGGGDRPVIHIVIVNDTSGSMGFRLGQNAETNLVMAKRAERTIATLLATKHVPQLRQRGLLGIDQPVVVSFLSFHSTARILRARVPLGDSVALEDALKAVEDHDESGGTNFRSYAQKMSELFDTVSTEECVVELLLTDGGAYDLDLFLADHRLLKARVKECRVVVIGFGAWVDEHTARVTQTDGYAMLTSFSEPDVVADALRLLPLAIIRAANVVTLSVEVPFGCTATVVAYDDASKTAPVCDLSSIDWGTLRFRVDPGERLRILFHIPEPEGVPTVKLNALDVPLTLVVANDTKDVTPALRMLELIDPMYARGNVSLLGTDMLRRRIATHIGLRYSLNTSYTKAITVCRMPTTLVGPMESNRPTASSMLPTASSMHKGCATSANGFGSHDDDDDDAMPVYRSLGGSYRSLAPSYRSLAPTNMSLRHSAQRTTPTGLEWFEAIGHFAKVLVDWTREAGALLEAAKMLPNLETRAPLQTGKRTWFDSMLMEDCHDAAVALGASSGGGGGGATTLDRAFSLAIAINIAHNQNVSISKTETPVTIVRLLTILQTP